MEREVGINMKGGVGVVGGGDFISYAKIEYKDTEVFWNANDLKNTSSSSVRSSSTFKKNINKHLITSVKWGQ